MHNQSVPFISTLNISLPSDYHVWPRGYSTKFYMGRFCARSNFCFHIPLLAQNCISSIGKWHPFQIPSLNLRIPFNCCNCTLYKMCINLKPEHFSWLFHKMHVRPLGPFHGPKWRNSLPFHVLQLVKSLPFHIT